VPVVRKPKKPPPVVIPTRSGGGSAGGGSARGGPAGGRTAATAAAKLTGFSRGPRRVALSGNHAGRIGIIVRVVAVVEHPVPFRRIAVRMVPHGLMLRPILYRQPDAGIMPNSDVNIPTRNDHRQNNCFLLIFASLTSEVDLPVRHGLSKPLMGSLLVSRPVSPVCSARLLVSVPSVSPV